MVTRSGFELQLIIKNVCICAGFRDFYKIVKIKMWLKMWNYHLLGIFVHLFNIIFMHRIENIRICV